jgi:hypothetical protein
MKKLAIIALLAGILSNQAHAVSFLGAMKHANLFYKTNSLKKTPAFGAEQEIIFGTFVNQKLMPQPDYSHYKRLAYMTAGMTGLFLLFSK